MANRIYEEPILKICPMCKEEKPYYNDLQIYCRDCADERQRQKRRKCSKNAQKTKKEPKKIEIVKPKVAIEDVLKFANDKGITYGKAVMMLSKEGA